eukprot:gnl/MRDRNA2_/MRDRNA2_95146_c0_seq1.p1 gnl/MRDRNA2_/MRDRNA2_95146_c0~~gnl/MRDRNA2_/MRDRNA2_95146_c0_seq1.p1  ORF type:complete len:411 (-),score=63.17 gnl/MRDRNA2_/MRDRNA2_95146_c0_seq1:85-1317(-)
MSATSSTQSDHIKSLEERRSAIAAEIEQLRSYRSDVGHAAGVSRSPVVSLDLGSSLLISDRMQIPPKPVEIHDAAVGYIDNSVETVTDFQTDRFEFPDSKSTLTSSKPWIGSVNTEHTESNRGGAPFPSYASTAGSGSKLLSHKELIARAALVSQQTADAIDKSHCFAQRSDSLDRNASRLWNATSSSFLKVVPKFDTEKIDGSSLLSDKKKADSEEPVVLVDMEVIEQRRKETEQQIMRLKSGENNSLGSSTYAAFRLPPRSLPPPSLLLSSYTTRWDEASLLSQKDEVGLYSSDKRPDLKWGSMSLNPGSSASPPPRISEAIYPTSPAVPAILDFGSPMSFSGRYSSSPNSYLPIKIPDRSDFDFVDVPEHEQIDKDMKIPGRVEGAFLPQRGVLKPALRKSRGHGYI